jgi:hypothetical protein
VKRIFHIKSLPAYDYESARKISSSKIEALKDEPELKLKRFKTQQQLKPPSFGAVKTARERNGEWGKKPKEQSQPNKSLTKSTNYRSPRADAQGEAKSKKSLKKLCNGMLKRVKEVVEEYQLRLDRCMEEKEAVVRENDRLRSQL